MSAMPAGWTETSDSLDLEPAPRARHEVLPSVPIASVVSTVNVPRRAELRAAQKRTRRSQQRWAVGSCVVVAAAFGITVGILDVLR